MILSDTRFLKIFSDFWTAYLVSFKVFKFSKLCKIEKQNVQAYFANEPIILLYRIFYIFFRFLHWGKI